MPRELKQKRETTKARVGTCFPRRPLNRDRQYITGLLQTGFARSSGDVTDLFAVLFGILSRRGQPPLARLSKNAYHDPRGFCEGTCLGAGSGIERRSRVRSGEALWLGPLPGNGEGRMPCLPQSERSGFAHAASFSGDRRPTR